MGELFLYSRDDCHLCDEMYSLVMEAISGTGVSCHIINIDGDPDLEHRYGARIPVLVADSEELCEIHLNKASLEQYIASYSHGMR